MTKDPATERSKFVLLRGWVDRFLREDALKDSAVLQKKSPAQDFHLYLVAKRHDKKPACLNKVFQIAIKHKKVSIMEVQMGKDNKGKYIIVT